MPSKPLALFIFCCVVLCAAVARAASDNAVSDKAASDKAVPQAPLAQQAAPKSNVITQAAVQAGVLACTSRINQVANFLTANAQNGVFLFVPSNTPDLHTFSTSLEIVPPNSSSLYASASFSPISGGGCDAVYDTVQFIQDTCFNVMANRLKVKGTPGPLKKDILVLKVGTARLFLMPAGTNGCIVIKKEVVQ
jgi:hypothetical protein